MPRMLDLQCPKCGFEMRDHYAPIYPIDLHCGCGALLQEIWWGAKRQRNAQWSDADAVVVFRKPDGSIAYPCRNSAPTPEGCERITMRSLPEVRAFERDNHVMNEVFSYDRNGRGLDDGMEYGPRGRRG